MGVKQGEQNFAWTRIFVYFMMEFMLFFKFWLFLLCIYVASVIYTHKL